MARDDEPTIENSNRRSRSGRERRRAQRRSGEDRREMIRFEPNKDDRRSGEDRRSDHEIAWDHGNDI